MPSLYELSFDPVTRVTLGRLYVGVHTFAPTHPPPFVSRFPRNHSI